MGIATNPTTLSKAFSIGESTLLKLGVLNPTLAIDTRLFVDPLLLVRSKHPEMKKDAVDAYKRHFEKIIKLLSHSNTPQDVASVAAKKLLQFPELKGTCLGYGAGSIRGSGFGETLSNRVLEVSLQIVKIGVNDPGLFSAMAIFEPDIGPDRLSDMTTNIIFPALVKFNARILKSLNLRGEIFEYRGVRGSFLINPFELARTPVILVPIDILRDLPIAHDWDGVVEVARQNDALRQRVNDHIAAIWATKTKRDKKALKNQALGSKQAFETLLASVRSVTRGPYDVAKDEEGLLRWAIASEEITKQYPLKISKPNTQTVAQLLGIVQCIVKQFRHLVENCGLNRELFRSKGKPRKESTAQRLFFAVAYSYCRANDIDVSPEIDTGNGKVDFKFAVGFEQRVLVEIKLSTNPSVVAGYTSQLEIYKQAQETLRAIYLVIDVGKMGKKDTDLVTLRNDAANKGDPLSELEFVDGTVRPTASKRK